MSLANCLKHLLAHGKAIPKSCEECGVSRMSQAMESSCTSCKYPDGFMKIPDETAAGVSPSEGLIEVPASQFPGPLITSCSVRVMRSFDYSHFEIVLGGTAGTNGMITISEADALRKHAARLADKAVEQYKIAKREIERQQTAQRAISYAFQKAEFERIDAKPETERTPEEMASWKGYKDALFHANRSYDYEDDWQADPDED